MATSATVHSPVDADTAARGPPGRSHLGVVKNHANSPRHHWAVAVVPFLLALGACDDSPPRSTPADAAAHAEEAAPSTAAETPDLSAVMAAYEACRAELASDSAAISGCAADLATAARSASGGSNAARVTSALNRVTKAADAMAVPTDDVQRARQSFAETSKEVIAVLEASGSGGPKHHVFECSMFEGSPRWVQRSDKAANPYMGAKMLECGAEVHHDGMRGDHHGGEHEMGGHHDDGKMSGKGMHGDG